MSDSFMTLTVPFLLQRAYYLRLQQEAHDRLSGKRGLKASSLIEVYYEKERHVASESCPGKSSAATSKLSFPSLDSLKMGSRMSDRRMAMNTLFNDPLNFDIDQSSSELSLNSKNRDVVQFQHIYWYRYVLTIVLCPQNPKI
jgi:hypothetical protein